MADLSIPSGIIVPLTSRIFEDLRSSDGVRGVFPEIIPASNNEPSSHLFAKTAVALALSGAPLISPVASIVAAESTESMPIQENDGNDKATLVVIGDSITVGRRDYGSFVQRMADADVEVTALDARVGRPASEAIARLDVYANEVATADAIFLPVGTNPEPNTAGVMLSVITHAYNLGMADGEEPIILVPELFGNNKRVDADTRNLEIATAITQAQGQGIDVQFLPYYNYVEQNVPLADGIHPAGDAGYGALVEYDVSIIVPKILTQGTEGSGDVPIILPTADTPIVLPPFNGSNAPVEVGAPSPNDVDPSGFIVDIKPIISQVESLASTSSVPVYEATEIVLPDPVLINFKTSPVPEISPPINSSDVVVPIFAIDPVVVTFDVPQLGESLPSTLPILPETTSVTPLPDVSTQTQEPAGQEVVPEIPEGMYTVSTDGVVDDSRLIEYIEGGEGVFKKALGLPDGYVVVPKNIPNLPYHFKDGTEDNNRIAAPKTAALAVIVADKVSELRQKYGIDESITFMDILGGHKEHHNGGDIDIGLLVNEEARQELLLFLLSLRNTDGSAYVHHIIIGDPRLFTIGNNYLTEMGYQRPRLHLQENHGSEPGGDSHWHVSLDGDSSGPFALPTPEGVLDDIEVITDDTSIPQTSVSDPVVPIIIDIGEVPVPYNPDEHNSDGDTTIDTNPSPEDQVDTTEVAVDDSATEDPVIDTTTSIPDATVPVDTVPVPDTGTTTETIPTPEGLRGDTIPEQIVNYYVDHGYTVQAAYGIAANVQAEAQFDPARTQNTWKGTCAVPPERLDPGTRDEPGPTRGYGFGIFQWTLAEYQVGLQTYADSVGTPWYDLKTQMEYSMIIWESSNPELHALLQTITDAGQAAAAVVSMFERPWPWDPGQGGNEYEQQKEMDRRAEMAYSLQRTIEGGEAASIEIACQ